MRSKITKVVLAFAVSALGLTSMSRANPSDPVNTFACDLYKQIASKDDGNVFFSPLSMESAPAMTAEGARGRTALEMGQVLGLDASRLTHNDATPYDFGMLHADLGQLSERLSAKPDDEDIRLKIAATRIELDAINEQVRKLNAAGHVDWQDADKLGQEAESAAARLNALLAQIDQYEFNSANALWSDKSFHIEQPYLDQLAKYYKTGGLMQVDFRGDPEAGRQKINTWVSERTKDRIKDLIAPGLISPDTRLVLTNAVYFKGQWSDPFKEGDTEQAAFTVPDQSQMPVAMMHTWHMEGSQYAAFNGDGSVYDTPDRVPMGDKGHHYPDFDGFLVAQLPYKGGAISMLVVLPISKNGMPALEKKLTGANVATWVQALQSRSFQVYLPRFKLDASYDMNEPLQKLGIKQAFQLPGPGGADFSGISSSTDPAQQIYIGAVVHKAFLEVNEKGTEAAAATAVIGPLGAAMPSDEPFYPTFRADHPFILVIRDNTTGTILFMGRITKQGV